jgi:DNA polymerase III delta prime subunit
MAKKIYEKFYDDNVLELNASDNRGLEYINSNLIFFCKKKATYNKKLLIFDEADNITKKA